MHNVYMNIFAVSLIISIILLLYTQFYNIQIDLKVYNLIKYNVYWDKNKNRFTINTYIILI